MTRLNDLFNIFIARLMIRLIRKGYGANCTFKDLDEIPDLKDNLSARCASCEAKEVVDWLEGHIELIK